MIKHTEVEPVLMYGASDCEYTEQMRNHLLFLDIPFTEIDITQNKEAEHFVIVVNNGKRSTPTMVLGRGKVKTVITEPTEEDFDIALSESGYCYRIPQRPVGIK